MMKKSEHPWVRASLRSINPAATLFSNDFSGKVMSGAEDSGASAPTGDEDPLVSPKGATSPVWTLFGFRAGDVDQKDVICKERHRVVSQSNTTNLFNHLKKHHKPK